MSLCSWKNTEVLIILIAKLYTMFHSMGKKVENMLIWHHIQTTNLSSSFKFHVSQDTPPPPSNQSVGVNTNDSVSLTNFSVLTII